EQGLLRLWSRLLPQLDRDLAIELGIAGLDDQAHPADEALERLEAIEHERRLVGVPDLAQAGRVTDRPEQLAQIGRQQPGRRWMIELVELVVRWIRSRHGEPLQTTAWMPAGAFLRRWSLGQV